MKQLRLNNILLQIAVYKEDNLYIYIAIAGV